MQSKSNQFDKENSKFLVDVNHGVSVQVSSPSHVFCLELNDLDFSGKNVGVGDDDEGVFAKMIRCVIMIEFSKSI